ncbi:MAG: hypothetical protein ACSHW7_00555 [Patiriisocius sp.]|uniref:hypothetical protein n=1 Tax=Patiriisocius sp. TaxID=2822396 RepID=UPI003EF3BC23
MGLLFNILLVSFLGAIVLQDFKYRAVHIFLLIAISILTTAIFYLRTGMVFNKPTLIYTVILFTVLWGYLCIKNNAIINPCKKYIGLGDILFILAVSPLFHISNFMFFFVSGIVLTLIGTLILQRFIHKDSIPFAGMLAGYLMIICIVNLSMDSNVFCSNLLKL